jgi:hypothetical protein
MSKLLRDNGLALTLGACCLLLSAWLYATDRSDSTASSARSPSPAVAAQAVGKDPAQLQVQTQTSADAASQQRKRRPASGGTQDGAHSGTHLDAAADTTRGRDQADGTASPDAGGISLAPADWHAPEN